MTRKTPTQEIAGTPPTKWQRWGSGALTALPFLAVIVSFGNFFLLTRDDYRDTKKDQTLVIQQLQKKDTELETKDRDILTEMDKRRDDRDKQMEKVLTKEVFQAEIGPIKSQLSEQNDLLKQILLNVNK